MQGRQINLDLARPNSSRQFCNKIWQAARFVMSHTGTGVGVTDVAAVIRWASESDCNPVDPPQLWDRWILSRLGRAARETEKSLTSLDFHWAARSIHTFIWFVFQLVCSD